jgi:integrase
MARTPKPWWRAGERAWYCKIAGKAIRLGTDRQRAHEAFYRLRGAALRQPITPASVVTIRYVLDAWLSWVQANRARSHYDWSRRWALSWLASVDGARPADGVLPIDLSAWADAHTTWSATTRRDAIASIQSAFRWAKRAGVISSNPVVDVPKPLARAREVCLTVDQTARLDEALGAGDPFRDVVRLLELTGCRPQELRRIEARHCQGDRWVIPPSEAKGGRLRVVVLCAEAAEISARLERANPEGPILRNTRGAPWTANAIRLRFRALRRRLGFSVLHAYAYRHTYATRAIERGVDVATLKDLMGHQSLKMITSVYAHVGAEHKRAAAELAVSGARTSAGLKLNGTGDGNTARPGGADVRDARIARAPVAQR